MAVRTTRAVTVSGTKMEKDWEALAIELRRRAGQRNTVAHGIWITTDVYPNDVLLTDPTLKKFVRYTVKDFDNMIEQIVQTHREVNDFGMRLWFQAAKAKPQPTTPPTET